MKISDALTKDKIGPVIETGLMVGLGTFILSYATLIFWNRNGFDWLEISLMTMLAGLYFFIVIIPANVFMLNRYTRSMLENGEQPIGRFYQVLIVVAVAIGMYLTIDSLMFLVDDTIPVAFGEALKQMAVDNGRTIAGMDEFATLPFGVQNGILTLLFGLVGALISLPFLKKNGHLFGSKNQPQLSRVKERI